MSLDLIDREAQLRYAERRQADLLRCREGLRQNDFSMIETVGHNLKGNGTSFGYPELSTLGELMENSAKRSDFEQSLQCLEQLQIWLDQHK